MRRVGEALAARYAEIGDAIADRVFEEIPGYGRRCAGADRRSSCRRDGDRRGAARTFAEGSTLRREDLAFLRDVAARRVHQGVSLEDFIHAYRVALHAIWDACAEEAARLRISRDAGFALARSAIDAIDTITTQAAEAYLREETRLRTQSGRAARDLVERLIDGQPIDPGRRHPAAPGLDPTGQLLTVVGRVEQTTLAIGDALQLSRDALEESMSIGTVQATRDDSPRRARPDLRRNLAAHQDRKPARGTPTHASRSTASTSATASASRRKASRASSRPTAKPPSRCPTPRQAGRSSRSTSCRHSNAL